MNPPPQPPPDPPQGYFPGAQELTLKLVYDKEHGGRILGAQAFGHAGVEKRIDAVAVGQYSGSLGRRGSDMHPLRVLC